MLLLADSQPITQTFCYLGMTFNVNGISLKEHVERPSERARKVVNIFVRVGFRESGFTPSTNSGILTTFLRPMLEYGLVYNASRKEVFNSPGKDSKNPLSPNVMGP